MNECQGDFTEDEFKEITSKLEGQTPMKKQT